MRLLAFELDGRRRVGMRTPEGIVDTGFVDLRDVIESPRAVRDAVAARAEAAPLVQPDRLLAPIAHRAQVIYTGGNYASHLQEVSHLIAPREPVFFPGLWSSVIGPGDPIVIPTEDTFVDWEAELAIVIGRTARKVSAADALDYVFGYTMVNDVSARDVMAREALQIMLCKSPDSFCPVGPEVVTADELGDIRGRRIFTTVNGVVKQESTTDAMVVGIPELLEFLTRTVTLEPGDVVTTGTPGGVGAFREPPEAMHPGDVVTVGVDGVGELSNPLVAGWTVATPDLAGARA